MVKGSRICYWICSFFFFFSLTANATTPVKSIIIFGDSLSDIGNTTQLIKSIKQDEDPSYLVRPVKQFIIIKMTDFAKDYYIPNYVLKKAIKKVTQFFDHDIAPVFADIVSKIHAIHVIPDRPYWNSRFSNGRVWIEYLAPMLGVDKEESEHYTNKAFSGSWAMSYNHQLTRWNLIEHPLLTIKSLINGKLIPPSLGLTVQAYLMETRKVDQDAVYFIFSGSNDYLNALVFNDTYNPVIMNKYIDNVLDSIVSSVTKLRQAGAKRFVILGIPHIGDSPIFIHTSDREILNNAVDIHNHRLEALVKLWTDSYPESQFNYVNIQTFFNRALNDPQTYGFTDVSSACIDVKVPLLGFANLMGSPFPNNFVLNYAQAVHRKSTFFAMNQASFHVCETPDNYLFWDGVHPSTKAHHLLAFEICEIMKTQGYEANCNKPVL